MEYDNIKELIAHVINDIRSQGYSSLSPFSIGKVEKRMLIYAQSHGIELGGDDIYISAKQLGHCLRPSKEDKGLTVSDDELISFPESRFAMDLYFDGKCFIYADTHSKFIIHPNYKMKISREVTKAVNFITASHRTDKKEFNGKRYVQIETGCATKASQPVED